MNTGEEDRSCSGSGSVYKSQLGLWAINIIVVALSKTDTDILNQADSSVFKHFEVHQSYTSAIESFSSAFMGYVAARLLETHQVDVRTSLRRLFVSSGLGHAFEFTAHTALLETSVICDLVVGKS